MLLAMAVIGKASASTANKSTRLIMLLQVMQLWGKSQSNVGSFDGPAIRPLPNAYTQIRYLQCTLVTKVDGIVSC